MKILNVSLFVAVIILCGMKVSGADEIDDVKLCNAIYKAEGGAKAQYLYGIRSVKYDTPEEARRICMNTIRNNRKRYADYGYKTHGTYLEFLQSRYCPIGCDNDRGENRFWIKNVKYFQGAK